VPVTLRCYHRYCYVCTFVVALTLCFRYGCFAITPHVVLCVRLRAFACVVLCCYVVAVYYRVVVAAFVAVTLLRCRCAFDVVRLIRLRCLRYDYV